MNSKMIVAVLAVIVIVVGGGAVAVSMMKTASDEVVPTGRLVVYGNANNDDYLNSKDVDAIKTIIDSSDGWDKEKYPFADTNVDGVVDDEDVQYLEDLLNKKSGMRMNYLGSNNNVYSISYPATGDIGCNMYYGLYDAMALGIYDRVTASTDRCINYEEDMFPGCKGFTMIGTNYTFDTELVMKSGIKIVLGANSVKHHDQLKDYGVDVVMLKGSGQSANGIDVISSIITMGVLLSCEDAAEEYKVYFDKIQGMIAEKSKEFDRVYTYVMPYNPDNPVQNEFDTASPTGSLLGDVYAMSLVPTKDLIVSDAGSTPTIQTEDIIKMNPDFIVVSRVAAFDAMDDPAEVQADFERCFEYYKDTEAYKNGNMVGIIYDSIGTTFGISTLPLVCSYMWPEIFDQDEAWKIFEEGIKKFTMIGDDVDIRECGGLLVYTME